MKNFLIISVATAAFIACVEHNRFTFCRDFSPAGCISPLADTAIYPLDKSTRSKTIRDFYNSIYFRGDRLAFELKNVRSKYEMTFECLHGRYDFADGTNAKHDIEYLELRESSVYGLVMIGSLIEKKFTHMQKLPYRPLAPFDVRYSIYCRKDLVSQKTVRVELK